MIVYPALEIRNGRATRVLQSGDIADCGEPVAVALDMQRQGAEYLHIIDVDAAADGSFVNREVIKEIIHSVKIPVECGGGVRSAQDISDRIENLGVYRVVLGTAAHEDAELLKWSIKRYGAPRIAVEIDALKGDVVSYGWKTQTGKCAVEFAVEMKAAGVKNLIYRDIQRKGQLHGADVETTERIVRATWLNVIAAGGIGSLSDISAAKATGACGLILGSALYDSEFSLAEAVKAAK